jgi:ubiquinone/menaquinone biosynthesis C-methylase UbiE
VTALYARWSAYLDQQHRYPIGLVGQLIGERMIRQHAPETAWSVALLNLRPIDRVLELGSGAGQGLALALRQRSYQIIGMDLSSTMIQAAIRRNRAALTHGFLSLVRGDIAALPFQGQRFDKIVSIHTLYFWPDLPTIFAQLAALLAPGGRSVTTFATARTGPTGERIYWPLHERAQALVDELNQDVGIQATLISGPDSRQFNNVAIIIDKQ